MKYDFNLMQVLYFLLFAFVFIVLLIVVIKRKLHRGGKYPQSVFMFRNSFLLVGFIISISLVFMVLNISTGKGEALTYASDNMDDILEVEIPVTKQTEKRKLPKPPPPLIETIPEDEVIDDQIEFLSTETGLDESIEYEEWLDTADITPPALPPPPVKNDKEEIVCFAEEMPRFPGCENKGTKDEREKCSVQKLMQYIYENLKYPAVARGNNIEGRVVVRFVIDKNGKVSDVEILRDIGGGCGMAAAKVIEDMNRLNIRWIPARQGGHKVKILYTLPILFKLKE